jgi:hypothetical protein
VQGAVPSSDNDACGQAPPSAAVHKASPGGEDAQHRGSWRRSGLTYPKMACADPVTSGSNVQIQPTAEGGMSMGSADLIDGLVVFYLFLFINIGGHMLPL